jgi:hypothetical protein
MYEQREGRKSGSSVYPTEQLESSTSMSGIVCTERHANNLSRRRLLQHATKNAYHTYYHDSVSPYLQNAPW